MLIRRYETLDARPVRELFISVNRALAPPRLRDAFEDYIAQSLSEEIDRIPAYYGERRGGFWVCEESRALCGMYGLERIDPRTAELRRMYVSLEHRRQGVAKALLAHAEAICRAAAIETLTLSTSELQAAALELYRSSGFRLTRREVVDARTNKTFGGGLRRYFFDKRLVDL